MNLLTLKYRPHTFSDLVGQDAVRMVLQALVFSNDMPPALLFGGPSGTGKTTAARVLAAALNCPQAKNGDCCGVCEICVSIQDGKSLSVHEIDSATNGGVEEIRALKDLAQFSVNDQWRVILLDEAHAMSKQAFNALLKILEEPPTRTVFVLLTTEPNKIMGTVRSRAMPINFRYLTTESVYQRLQHVNTAEQIHFSEEIVKEIADAANGGMRNALMMLDQARRAGVPTAEALQALTGRTKYPSHILTAIVSQDHTEARRLLTEYFQVSASTNDLLSGLIEDLQTRFSAGSIQTSQMITATKLLWDARSSSGIVNRDVRLQMEALITLLYAVFRVDKPKPILPEKSTKVLPTQKQEERGLGLSELVGLLEG